MLRRVEGGDQVEEGREEAYCVKRRKAAPEEVREELLVDDS